VRRRRVSRRDERAHHRLQRSGALRSVPSPVHGTSHRIRSNLSRSEPTGPCMRVGSICASWLVTIKRGELRRLAWWTCGGEGGSNGGAR
jgi:hypothetical protein